MISVAAHTIQPGSRALATAVRKASSSISWSTVLVRRRLPRRDLSVEKSCRLRLDRI